MPTVETVDRHQKACLWEYSDDAEDGFEVSAVQEIDVRWVPKTSVDTGPTGETHQIDVTVIAGQSIKAESILWLGEEDDLPSDPTAANAFTPALGYLYQVKTVNETLDIKGRNTRRRYGLVRWGMTLPTIAS